MSTLPLDMRAEGWGGVATAYDEEVSRFTRNYADQVVEQVGVQQGQRVLDIAAGSGSATFSLLDRGAEVVATDYAPEMIDRLNAHLSQEGREDVETIVMDAQDLKFADATFDAAVSVFGFMFFPDKQKGFDEMFRVVKPGGRAGIAVWAEGSKVFPIAVFGQTLKELLPDWQPPVPPPIFSLADPELVRSHMSKSGFQDVEVASWTGTFEADSAEDYYSNLSKASPVFTAMADLMRGRDEEYRQMVLDKLRDRYGEGALKMEAEALIATATKP